MELIISWKQHRLTLSSLMGRCFHHKFMRIIQRVLLKSSTRLGAALSLEISLLQPHCNLQVYFLLAESNTPSSFSTVCSHPRPTTFTPPHRNHSLTKWEGNWRSSVQPPSSWRNALRLSNSHQAGGRGGSRTQSPALQPAPPAKEILQKLFHLLEDRRQY